MHFVSINTCWLKLHIYTCLLGLWSIFKDIIIWSFRYFNIRKLANLPSLTCDLFSWTAWELFLERDRKLKAGYFMFYLLQSPGTSINRWTQTRASP